MHADPPTVPPAERGAALLTVLLIVSIISIMAAALLDRVRIATRMAGNDAAIEQAQHYAMAAETLALTRLNVPTRTIGARLDVASVGRVILPIDGGTLTASARDAGNCFNLNTLVSELGPNRFVANPERVKQFTRLMQSIGIGGVQASSIAAATADWIDTDDVALPFGAEDEAYKQRTTPYRAANTLMADASELRAVAGVTPGIYAKLQRWICAFPDTKPSRLNINTLSADDAPLLALLLPETTGLARVRSLLGQRPREGFSDARDFWRLSGSAGIVADQAGTGQLGVASDWIGMEIAVRIGTIELEEHALIDVSHQPARLVSRRWGDAS